MKNSDVIYAFRRRGFDDFCTCSEDRYNELSEKPSTFEVAIFYTEAPAVAQEQSHAEFPRADSQSGGWTIDCKFLKEISNQISAEEIVPGLEEIQSVLIALEKLGYGKESTAVAQPPADVVRELVEVLNAVALVAHHGGLIELSERDALILIRKLTGLHQTRKQKINETRAALKEIAEQEHRL